MGLCTSLTQLTAFLSRGLPKVYVISALLQLTLATSRIILLGKRENIIMENIMGRRIDYSNVLRALRGFIVTVAKEQEKPHSLEPGSSQEQWGQYVSGYKRTIRGLKLAMRGKNRPLNIQNHALPSILQLGVQESLLGCKSCFKGAHGGRLQTLQKG